MDFALPTFIQDPGISGVIEGELIFVILISIAALVAIASRRIRLPYTVALVLVGLVLSLLPNPLHVELSSDLILALLVPPLIFEATLNLKWDKLRHDLGPILLLAVVGTLAGTFIVGSIVMLIGRTLIPGVEIPFAAAVAFGALISATDPVAVLAFFRSLGVAKRLSVLVEGESLFNDGVAIVVFNIAVAAGALAAGHNVEPFSLGNAIFDFFKVSFGGLAVGVGLGLVVSYIILKNVDDHLIETATTVALAFGSFVIAEEFHLSGILAVVAAGLFVGNVGTQNTSPTTKVTLDNFWEFVAFVVNSLVFLLIGLETDVLQDRPNLIPIIVAVIAVLLSRAIVVYALTWLHGRITPKNRIPLLFRHVMYWGGLRGAISLALALTLTGSTFGSATVAQELKLMTFGVVLFTLIVQGISIAPLIRYLGLSKKPEQMVQQQRRQALLHATRAGKDELDKLHEEGILPGDVWQAMAEVYDDEIDRRNQSLRDLLRVYPELEQEIVLQAREDVLQAERSALADLNRRGLISEQVYHDLIQETDGRTAALELIRSTWGMGNMETKESENQDG